MDRSVTRSRLRINQRCPEEGRWSDLLPERRWPPPRWRIEQKKRGAHTIEQRPFVPNHDQRLHNASRSFKINSVIVLGCSTQGEGKQRQLPGTILRAGGWTTVWKERGDSTWCAGPKRTGRGRDSTEGAHQRARRQVREGGRTHRRHGDADAGVGINGRARARHAGRPDSANVPHCRRRVRQDQPLNCEDCEQELRRRDDGMRMHRDQGAGPLPVDRRHRRMHPGLLHHHSRERHRPRCKGHRVNGVDRYDNGEVQHVERTQSYPWTQI